MPFVIRRQKRTRYCLFIMLISWGVIMGTLFLQQAMQFAGFDITPGDVARAYNRFPQGCEDKLRIPLYLAHYTESDIIWVAEEIRKWLETLPEIERASYSREYQKKRTRLDFKPDLGSPSEKAKRLVKFCLGEYYEKPVPACTGNLDYLENESILLLEVAHNSIVLSAGLSHGLFDQKEIITALIDQRAVIPNGLRCWLEVLACERRWRRNLNRVRRGLAYCRNA